MTSAMNAAGIACVIGDPGAAVGWDLPAGPPAWPDHAVHAAELPGLTVRAASARGRVHRYAGTPRQDACAVSWSREQGRLVVVACDGVGSLERSHEAADLVASAAASAVCEAIDADEPDWTAVFALLSSELIAAAGVTDGNDRARAARRVWATTACIAEISSAGGGAWSAHMGAAGDTSAWLLRDREWSLLCGDVKVHSDDEPASARTHALPADVIGCTTATVTLHPGDAVFLMSDGVADPLGGGGGDVGAALADWWSAPPEPHEFLGQIQFARKGFLDDRTVIGVWVDQAVDAGRSS